MDEIDILKTDFHALRVLAAVRETGSYSAAAARLELSQSTVSYTIDRLRGVFGDALFVRMGRGIIPTARCEAIASAASIMIEQFEALTRPERFMPATASGRIVISCNYYERSVLVPTLAARVAREAPALRLAFIQAHAHGHRQLLDGECELLISPLPSDTSGLFTRALVEERYALFVARESRHAAAGMTLEDYRAARHVAVLYEGGWKPFYQAQLKALGVEVTPAVEMPSFGGVGELIAGSELVLTAPSGLEAALSRHCVRLEAPFECRFPIHMFWTGRAHDTPLNRWLRGHVAAAARAVQAR